MDRRRFIAGCAATTGFIAFGGYVVSKRTDLQAEGLLQASLCPLFGAQFKALADRFTTEALMFTLTEKKVLSRSKALDVRRVSELARSDEMKAYNQFFFEYDETPLLTVNCTEIDIIKKQGDYKNLLREILNMRKGKLKKHYISISSK